MKFQGFIGPAYQLDSVNVASQRCVNLYPELIEGGGVGKAAQIAYLRGTPGLENILEVGDGPIRLIHVDSIGRIFVVSGNQIYLIIHRDDWAMKITPVAFTTLTGLGAGAFDPATDLITSAGHGYYTGLKIRGTASVSMPTGLTAATDYWVIVIDANNFKLASSLANAVAGTAINFTADPGGTVTITPQIPAQVTGVELADFDLTTDTITAEANLFYVGLKVRLTMSGTMPTGILPATDYFVIDSSADSLQLASTLPNAIAGTKVDITAISTEDWATVLVGANGEVGGNPFLLSSVSGAVKAASMSFGGDGTDSSTIFVDGVNNYLFKDEAGVTTLGVLGEIDVAQAVFDIDDDITMYSTTDVEALIASGTFNINVSLTTSWVPAGEIVINLYTDNVDSEGGYSLKVHLGSGATLTTAELVSYINNGFVSGKTITFNNFDHYSVDPNRTEISSFAKFAFSGGGIQSADLAFTGGSGQTETFSRQTFSGLEFGSVPTATDIAWSDGYFILAEGGTNRFRVSDLQSFNVDTLSFASSEGNPDIVLALKVLNRYLYVFNEKTTEVYADTGNADFPFERIQGGFIEMGCAAARSVAKIISTVCWLGRSEDGEGIVYSIEGSQPKRISTHAIEQAIRGYADISTATAYSYQTGGHGFYVLNFAEATWVYDLATGLWHERAYSNEGVLERHRAQYCAFVQARRAHLVSDYETNKIYTLSESVYSDDGDEIVRIRATPHLSSGRNRLFCSRFSLDMEVGVGLDGDDQGSDPEVVLDWSDDGGHTWSNELWAEAGAGQIGEYETRVVWNRLGSFRQRVFRVTISDPVKVRLIDAQIEVVEGAN